MDGEFFALGYWEEILLINRSVRSNEDRGNASLAFSSTTVGLRRRKDTAKIRRFAYALQLDDSMLD